MRRFLVLIGVCGLLLSAQIEAKERSNKKSFWDLWGSESENTAPAAGNSDFTLEGEGSGFYAKYDLTHLDDEDVDDASGDGSEEITPGKTTKVDKNDVKPEATVEDVDDTKEDSKDKDDYYKFGDNVTDDDDDDVMLDGSGSGDYKDDYEDYNSVDEETETTVKPPVKPTTSTTSKPLSACENLRISAINVADFVPECASDGSFKKQQCTVDLGNKGKYCWCVNQEGGEIQGTRLEHPEVPDCDFGTNLPGCVFTRIQHSEGDLGAYKPKCTSNGEYESKQCQGSECWCVDKYGNEKLGSIVNLPKQPDCSEGEKSTLAPPMKTDKPKPEVIPEEEGSYEVIDKDKGKDNNKEEVIILGTLPEGEDENNNNNDPEGYQRPLEKESQAILAQPGLLAAIIGGAVVGLLCMVLLVMFIVYRMRKKDEGSYALEEQKYQNYSYAKAPDKEFYA